MCPGRHTIWPSTCTRPAMIMRWALERLRIRPCPMTSLSRRSLAVTLGQSLHLHSRRAVLEEPKLEESDGPDELLLLQDVRDPHLILSQARRLIEPGAWRNEHGLAVAVEVR